RETSVTRLLDALGVIFEKRSPACMFAFQGEPNSTALMLSEEQFLHLRRVGLSCSRPVRDVLSRYSHVLLYPFQGTDQGLRALSECIDGRVESAPPSDGSSPSYSITTNFPAAGPFAGLTVGPASRLRDRCLLIRDSPHPVQKIVTIADRGLLTLITLPTTQFFVASSTAVFDVQAEISQNLQAYECFSGLVPLLLFLRHSAAAFWRTPYCAANVIIDDINLRPSYGFVKAQLLAEHVDKLGCAVSIAFIPWNWDRTSRHVAELFRSRWPYLSLCIHGCDHIGAEFCTESLLPSLQTLALSVERMQQLMRRTGVSHDRVMVFPQGRFPHAAMEALAKSDFLAAVNTELADHRTQTGVVAGELLKPAITSYAGFPLFFWRKAHEPLANFALDLLLGKPCLVVTHHDDFRGGMQPFVSLVCSLDSLDGALQWTNLATIVRQTYSIRMAAESAVDVRLF